MIKFLILFCMLSSAIQAQDVTESTEEVTTPTTTTTTTEIPIYFLSDGAPTLTWSPDSNNSVIVEVDEGYKIAVNITECNFDGDNGEYATITRGENTTGLLFSYFVTSDPAYIFNTNLLLGEFVGTNASNFTAIFTRFGDQLTTTTTEIPTTVINLPTPGVNDSYTLTVYMAAKNESQYETEETQNLFRNAVVGMATEYCENENFALNETITIDNVIIDILRRCPVSWPDSETCVEITFRVPVILDDTVVSTWTGYQLNSNHLRLMWDRYASKYLSEDLIIYTTPDLTNFKWAILIALGILTIFVLCLVGIRYSSMKVSKMMRRRKLSDVASIITTSDRDSQVSLPPHYLQEIPALFENAYHMYNPEENSPFADTILIK